MASYGSSLATVVAIVVLAAAAAGFLAAASLILASALRRQRLAAAISLAAEMGRLLRPAPGTVADGPSPKADPPGEGRPPLLRDLRPREWEWLVTTRSAEPGGIWALDELAGMPAELLDWAGRHGPHRLRSDLPVARDLLAIDHEVRTEMAAPRRPATDPGPPPATTEGGSDTPVTAHAATAEKQERLRRLAAERRFRPRR